MSFQKDVLANGSNPLLLLDELRVLGECNVKVHTVATPPLKDIDPQDCYFSWDVELTTTHSKSDIEDVFIFVASEMKLEIEELAAPTATDPSDDRPTPDAAALPPATIKAGAEVLISVSDDGKGLDTQKIRAKAEESGLIPPGAALSDGELNQFLFNPGFTTALQVSDLSGRGVGLDVVRRAIEGMRGSIDVSSEPGKGSTFTLRLPLTLAIIEGLLVRVADARYVVPLTAVEECVELSAAADTSSKGSSFLNIRGELVPFLRLRELFAEKGEPDPYQKVVIVANTDARVGLVVDQITGSHQTVIKSLSKLHADAPSFCGATILGDGAVALILDVPRLIAAGQAREARLQSVNWEAA